MTYYHLVFIFYLILISSCKNDTKSSYVSQIEFIEKYKDFQFDQNRIEQAIRLGLLNFDEVDCGHKIEVKEPVKLSLPFAKFETNNMESYLGDLYQFFGDPTQAQTENIDYQSWTVDLLISKVKSGEIAPQCEGISRISKKIILENTDSNIEIRIIRTDIVEHTLNAILFQNNLVSYAVCFDIQNGYFFPSKSPDSLSFFTIQELAHSTDTLKNTFFYWLPEKVLLKKRNLLDEILPCNFLSMLGEDYYYPQKGSPYKYELLGPSFHKVLWFDLETIDQDAFKNELLENLRN
jgi:hypothetical protein